MSCARPVQPAAGLGAAIPHDVDVVAANLALEYQPGPQRVCDGRAEDNAGSVGDTEMQISRIRVYFHTPDRVLEPRAKVEDILTAVMHLGARGARPLFLYPGSQAFTGLSHDSECWSCIDRAGTESKPRARFCRCQPLGRSAHVAR